MEFKGIDVLVDFLLVRSDLKYKEEFPNFLPALPTPARTMPLFADDGTHDTFWVHGPYNSKTISYKRQTIDLQTS